MYKQTVLQRLKKDHKLVQRTNCLWNRAPIRQHILYTNTVITIVHPRVLCKST